MNKKQPPSIDKKPDLRIVPGDRSKLEQEVVRLAWFGTNSQLKAGIARLQRRGNLHLVLGPDDLRAEEGELPASAAPNDQNESEEPV